jgi:eukaryotic-like serine/threonine-protein kinase
MASPQLLNHYRIVAPLGKGAMGEVFIAEDTRLHRKVALKVLSELTAADPERRHRFEREAQAVAAINHPNIVTIHSVEEAEGVPFITMELVEGKPLNQVISAGGLPLDVLLRTGIAISDAVAAAHQRGITHRDLKPANVMITPEGRVKVLDFGLAKLREEQAAGSPDDVTRVPATDLTGEGRIIGTVAYMSPEQAEGKPVDSRSDIFSLGVMLHEMATGEKPFKGDTNVSVISSILKDTPSAITDINPHLPADLSRVIRRTLAKDPSRRFQTATDLRNELEELKQQIDSGVTTAMSGRTIDRGRHTRKTWVVAIAAIVLFALIFALLTQWTKRSESAAAPPFEPDRFTRITESGTAFLAAISPDGRYIVHVKSAGTVPSLWVRQTKTTSDVQIVPPEQVKYDGVSFSPDGDHVYFVTYQTDTYQTEVGGVGTLYRVPALGGTPQRILEDVDSRVSFSPDRKKFTFMRGAPARGAAFVMVANADGSAVRQVASLTGAEKFLLSGPSWSPDGRTILAAAQSLKGIPTSFIVGIDVATGAISRPQGQWQFVGDIEWLPDGRSFAVPAGEYGGAGGQIWQIPYPTGERRRITNDASNYLSVSIAADGRSLITVQNETTSNVWVAPADDLAGGRQITTGRGQSGVSGIAWAPDGRLVFGALASTQPQIWISNAEGAASQQLTSDDRPSLQPDVTPDGRYIVFERFTPAGVNVWRMGIDGSDQRQLTRGTADLSPKATDKFVYYSSAVTGVPRTWRVPIEGGEPVSLGEHHFQVTQVSRDGKSLLGAGWDESLRRSVLAVMPAEGGVPQFIPNLPPFAITWNADGKSFLFMTPQAGTLQLFRYAPGDKGPVSVAKLKDTLYFFAWSRDGKQAALARGESTSDVVLITAKSVR